MNNKENQIYLDKIEEIGDKVYELYNMSVRKDLIMLYNMQEEKIYSYTYEDFKKMSHEKLKKSLKFQYEEAKKSDKIVLFIQDDLRKKLKSFSI